MPKSLSAGILAHVDAGKTTLIESMLFESAAIRKQGRVDHQNSFLDYDEQERARGITIYSKDAELTWKDTSLHLIDTPGHVDFSAEMERALSVLDLGVLLISAPEGVQAHTKTIWNCLRHYGIPVLLFVNKMDLSFREKSEILAELSDRLSGSVIDMEADDVLEQLALLREEDLDAFMETGKLPEGRVREAFLNREFVPVLFGSVLKNEGTAALLDMLDYLTPEKSWPEEFMARVFRISEDDRGNRLTHIKMLGGSLKARQSVDQAGKADQIRIYSGKNFSLVPEIRAGEIAAVKGFDETFIGQGLGSLEDLQAPMLEPSLSYDLLLPAEASPAELMADLRKMAMENPSLQVEYDELHKKISVRFMGAIQMEVFQKELARRTGFTVGFSSGHVLFRETIAEDVMGYGHFEPLRHYAEVHLRLEPLPRNAGLQFSMNCPRDTLPLHWQRTIVNAISERRHKGVLMGAPITDMKITLTAGRAHQKHTESSDFSQAARRAIRQGLMKAESILLEPYSSFRIETGPSSLSRILYDLENRKCSFETENGENDEMVIQGRGPLRLLMNYQQDLASLSRGEGRITMQSDGYDICPDADSLIEEAGYDPEADLSAPAGSVFCSHGSGTYVPWYEVEDQLHIPIETERNGSFSMNAGHVSEEEARAVFERAGGSRSEKKPAKKNGWNRKNARPSGPKVDLSDEHQEVRISPHLPECLIVDGYNMIYSWPELKSIASDSLSSAREELISRLSHYQGYRDCSLIIVFDGWKRAGNTGSRDSRGKASIVYTPSGMNADSYIEKTVHDLRGKFRITAATSDALIQNSVFASGASRISARELERRLEEMNRGVRKKIQTSF